MTRRSRLTSTPRPGYFKLKLAKDGPWVPAVIFYPCPHCPPEEQVDPDFSCCEIKDRAELVAVIDGKRAKVDRVWLFAEFCEFDEYRYLMELRGWAKKHSPAEANARAPVDIRRLPAPRF